ncbi:MAG: hypothetical protein CV089_01580 [Nitrospira sp. WS110]|nr:hypothetical protein [Nitrospira sp. WS110]
MGLTDILTTSVRCVKRILLIGENLPFFCSCSKRIQRMGKDVMAEMRSKGISIDKPVVDRRSAIYSRLRGLENRPGIEIAPGSSPILEKGAFNVIYVDKFDHRDNSDTYLQGQPVYIDCLLGDKLIDEILALNTFSYVVSSHVIEHMPDFIQFFKSVANILRDGARLVMYVPDKRYTFDVLRPVSTITDIEEAHNQHLRHPSRAMARDVHVNSDFSAEAAGLWDKSHRPIPTRDSTAALKIADELDLAKADLHCFTFTSESFLGLINHVIDKHVPAFRVLEITDTPYGCNEFIVDLVLRKYVRLQNPPA